MKNILFAALAAVSVAAVSCNGGGPFPGFEKQAPSTYIKFHKKGEGLDTAGQGGVVFLQLSLITPLDSLIQDFNAARGEGSVSMRLEPPRFKGDFLDVISKMHKGDSATFFVNLDTIKKYFRRDRDEFPLEPKYDSLKFIGFRVKVDSLYTKAVTEKKIKEMQEKQERQMAEMKNAEAGKIQAYLTKNKLTDLKPDEKGIYFKVLKPGNGKQVTAGMEVSARYKGTFTDGTPFDGNFDRPEPMRFTAGSNMVPGFTDCILRMKDGSRVLFILPSSQAYGEMGNQGIPPYEPLVFEVEIKIENAKPAPAPPAVPMPGGRK
ncbi:MAG: FKBP-type peptidyl-prolyl cis-trans isomerase [Bacteroidia bacterium]|jgi:FKBP-type peptidyl-prolyl cis-trans isomerase|nr:FKBP-type peptidyl-prolyl cis-trans isomerase [Bacteroidia bacterium]